MWTVLINNCQVFVPLLPHLYGWVGDGLRADVQRSDTLRFPAVQSVKLVAYYAKYTSMELYYSKEPEQGQKNDFNMSLQNRTFSRTVKDKKSLAPASPHKWEGNGYKWLVHYNISKKTELADSAAERRDGLILLWQKTILDIRAEYW